MKNEYLTTTAMAAALIMATACSDPHARPGKPLPAPSGSTEAAGRTASSQDENDGVATPEEVERTEFAALDTNANGALEQGEWEAKEARALPNLKNMTFAQLDRNSSGALEPAEFRDARTSGDASGEVSGSAGGNAAESAEPAIRETGGENPETDAQP